MMAVQEIEDMEGVMCNGGIIGEKTEGEKVGAEVKGQIRKVVAVSGAR